jgi:hypothetical protein
MGIAREMGLGDSPSHLIGFIMGAIAGWITGLILLRQIEPSIQWKYVSIVAFGWAIAWAISGSGLIGPIIGGTIGGVLTGLVLRWTKLFTSWKQILTVTIGWAVGWSIGWIIGYMIPDDIYYSSGYFVRWILGATVGVISAAVGSWVMFWQLNRAHRSA